MAWAVSGSVSLELMMEALPTVILYKLNRFDLWIARPFIKAKYITLVNLLADAELMPEYLTGRTSRTSWSGWARTWLDDPIARAAPPPTWPPCGIRSPGPAPPGALRPHRRVPRTSMPSTRPRRLCLRGPHESAAHEDNFVELPDLKE